VGPLRRWLDRLTETDESRLSAEVRDWAATVGGAVPISEAPRRQRVRIAGVIRRMTVFPMRDGEALEALVADGSGEVVVRFMGRRAIGGLGLGSKIVVEGVIGEQQGAAQMINPMLEFSSR
jgi:RecG-like helicase